MLTNSGRIEQHSVKGHLAANANNLNFLTSSTMYAESFRLPTNHYLPLVRSRPLRSLPCTRPGGAVLHCNALDHHGHILWQGLRRNTGPCGLVVGKVLCVYRVHPGEVTHVAQENSGLEDHVEAGAGGPEDGADIGEDDFGAFFDRALDDFTLGSGGDLSGNVDEAAGFNGLNIGTEGEGGIGGENGLGTGAHCAVEL